MGGYLLEQNEIPNRAESILSPFPRLAPLSSTQLSKPSGSERNMVSIGRALIPRPSLLILDEPTSNLFIELPRFVLEDQVRGLAGENMAVLLVEQKAGEALEVLDWAYVLVNGSVWLSGSSNEPLARSDIAEIFLGLVPSEPAVPYPPGACGRQRTSERDQPPEEEGGRRDD